MRWAAGDEIAFRGTMPGPGTLSWVITLDHCPHDAGDCHSHPLQRASGASGVIAAPEHDHPSRLVFTLVARDPDGHTSSTTVRLEQREASAVAPTPAAVSAGHATASPASPLARPLAACGCGSSAAHDRGSWRRA